MATEEKKLNSTTDNNEAELDSENPNSKVNIDEIVEKNISIRVMPRKFKVSSAIKKESSGNKTVGLVIISVGILVLIALVYLGYIYLIKPGVTPANNIKIPAVVNNQTTTPLPEKTAVIPIVNKVATSTIATSTINLVASSTPVIATSTTAQAMSTSAVVATVGPITDTDGDGLSDQEEAIFGTDINNVDTDGDGYTDGAEVAGLYNPIGAGKLTADSNIATYKSSKFKYSLLYPKAWKVQGLGNGETEMFSLDENTFIQVVYQPNVAKQDILSWYQEQFPDTTITSTDLISKNGWQGLYHIDKKVFYLTDNARNSIFAISYVPENESDWNLHNIFELAVNSFMIQ